MKHEVQMAILLIGIFAFGYFVPFDHVIIQRSFQEAFFMLQEYTREHILTCLIPAFFIAGAISVFLSQGSIIKYLGYQAPKWVSYSVASVSGTILAVCSCTVLPLFAGIQKKGAGLGPAIAFLYSGPAINVLAILLTFKILGTEIGVARFIGAVLFAIIIGIIMAFLFRKENKARNIPESFVTEDQGDKSSLWKNGLFFLSLIFLLIFASWGKPNNESAYFFNFIFSIKWYLTGAFVLIILLLSLFWIPKDKNKLWLESTWDFSKKILPLLFGGVLLAGFLMGRPGHDALIPYSWVSLVVGDNSITSTFFASIIGAFMYFATLTEIPILESLIGAGMAKGPALSLLLSGPAISLPSMMALSGILGVRKTVVYIVLVVIMATFSGWVFGLLV